MKTYEIDITINDGRWIKKIPNIEAITRQIVNGILDQLLNSSKHIEISIVLANDKFVKNLNKTYRHKDKPTNVLSFQQANPDDLTNSLPLVSLGDVVIALDTIIKESLEQKKDIKDHYIHMLTHGCLHLLDYDHVSVEEAEKMESLEIDILSKLGIKNPYETL